MTREEISSFAAAWGFRMVGDKMVGVFQGYPFSALFRSGSTSVLNASLVLAKTPKNRSVKELKGILPKGVTVSRFNVSTMMLACSARDGELTIKFVEGMKALTGLLREEGLLPPERCPLCNQGGCDAAALTGSGPVGSYLPVHQRCCQERSYSAVSHAEVNSLKGNYLPGFIGAMLGGAVGAIPSILTIIFLETIYALLYALIPLAAYYGYKLFKGKMNLAATVAAVVSAVFQLFMVEWTVFWYALHVEYDIWPNPFQTVMLYYQVAKVSDMVADMAMPALFTILGLWIVFSQITRTNKTAVVDANAALDSITPYSPIRR